MERWRDGEERWRWRAGEMEDEEMKRWRDGEMKRWRYDELEE
jgi:hypothetical protein